MAVKTFGNERLVSTDINTFLANAGLVYVKSQTVGSGVTSISVTNAFSSTYDNYLITVDGVDGSAGGYGFRLSFNVDTSAVYDYSGFFMTYGGTGFTNTGAANQTSIPLGFTGTENDSSISTVIYNPYAAKRTTISSRGESSVYGSVFGGVVKATGQNTGFTLTIESPATVTGGSITVYGYRKA